MPEPKRTYAMLLQTESNYGTKTVTARVVYTTLEEPHVLHSPSDHAWGGGAEYCNFAVHAYLGHRHDDLPIWGVGHSYTTPHRVQLRDAERMVKLLRKVEKGLEKMRQEEGWLDPNDFHGYVLRVARVLGIKIFYVHADDQQRMVGMSKWRKLDGSGAQSWLAELSNKIAKQLNPAS